MTGRRRSVRRRRALGPDFLSRRPQHLLRDTKGQPAAGVVQRGPRLHRRSGPREQSLERSISGGGGGGGHRQDLLRSRERGAGPHGGR
ncbi:unnamed protein product [Merluccius merluccius]